MTFADLEEGDTFTISGHLDRQAYHKIEPNVAREVNGSAERNMMGDERVNVLITAADRQAAIRRDEGQS